MTIDKDKKIAKLEAKLKEIRRENKNLKAKQYRLKLKKEAAKDKLVTDTVPGKELKKKQLPRLLNEKELELFSDTVRKLCPDIDIQSLQSILQPESVEKSDAAPDKQNC